jgi:uncharacterized protein YdhG (YjbR/CyaY superfamily)
MSTIDDYLINIESLQKTELEKVRNAVKKAVPEAQEVITYGMPGFKYKGKYLIAFAPFKDHLSIFPGTEAVEAFKNKLSGYKTSKGTIQFTVDNPIPEDIIIDICQFRAQDINSKI